MASTSSPSTGPLDANVTESDFKDLLPPHVDAAVLAPNPSSVPYDPLEVAQHPVGLDEMVEEVESRLETFQEEQKVKIVGIFGMGGSGKTTLAKEIYNRKCSLYDRSSFVFDVRDAAGKKTLQNLQKKLAKDLLRDKFDEGLSFDSITEGKRSLRSCLMGLRVLVVLDDIDHVDQIDALLPSKDIFQPGSLIVIITRDAGLLRSIGISFMYRMKALHHFHARELFCWYAFLQSDPLQGFENLVEQFLTICHGLPLSLRVLGAQLCNNSDKRYWESLLDKTSRIVPDDIQRILKASFDALDPEEQDIFLDTACFFIGEEKDLAVQVWDGLGLSGLHSWERISNKCLVELDQENRIRMDDNLRNMGREIARTKLPYRFLPFSNMDQETLSANMPIRHGVTDMVSAFNRGVIVLTLGNYGLQLSAPVFWLCWSILVPEAVIVSLIQPYWKWIKSAMPAQTAHALEDSEKLHRPSGRAEAVFLKVGISLAVIAMLIFLEDLSQKQNKIVLFVGLSSILLEGFQAIFVVKKEFQSFIQNPMQMIRSITGQDWNAVNFLAPSVINAMIIVTGEIVLGGNLGSLMRQRPFWIFVAIVVVDLIAEAIHRFDCGYRSDSIPERKPRWHYIGIVLRLIVEGPLCCWMAKEILQNSNFLTKENVQNSNFSSQVNATTDCDLKCRERSKSLLITMVVLGGLQAALFPMLVIGYLFSYIYKFLRTPSQKGSQDGSTLTPSQKGSQDGSTLTPSQKGSQDGTELV